MIIEITMVPNLLKAVIKLGVVLHHLTVLYTTSCHNPKKIFTFRNISDIINVV
jgi:hypothetical protein